MNVANLLAHYLQKAGIQYIFGYPGDPSVEVLEACRQNNLNFILTRREGTAGLMAQAAGMLSGKPGIALSTLGPGSTNLVNSVANAYLDRTPMIALSGQIDTLRLPTFTHQVVDHEAMFSPVSKWTSTLTAATTIHQLRKAHRIATAPRMGPVHLSTPADVVGADVEDDDIVLPPTAVSHVGLQTVDASLADIKSRVNRAKQPLMLVGISAMQQDAGPAITDLAEHLGAAVISSPMAKGTVDESHPLFAGTLDMACNQVMWSFVNASDLILTVGFDAVELIKPWNVTADVVHIDVVPNTDQIYYANVEMVGSIDAICMELQQGTEPRLLEQEKAVAEHRRELQSSFNSGRTTHKLNPSDVIHVARHMISTDSIVTTDVGSHKLLVGQGWRCSKPRQLLMTNGLSSMGFSLPAAMSAKLLYPEKEVVCFTGDGGLAMVQSELQVAASLGLGIRVVVFIDQSLNRIELKQMARNYPSTGTLIEKTDVCHLAKAMSCDGFHVETEAELQAALSTPVSNRPQLIGVVIDPAQYRAQF